MQKVIVVVIVLLAWTGWAASDVEIQTKDGEVYGPVELLDGLDGTIQVSSTPFAMFNAETGEWEPQHITFGDDGLNLQDVINALEKANRWLVKSSEYNGPMISAEQEKRRNEDIDYLRDVTYRLKRVFE